MAAPGSHTFFHKPPVNPNLATLLHCTQISAINFPHCAVARLSAANPPPPPPSSASSSSPSISPSRYPPHPPRLSFLYNPAATAVPFHPSPTHPAASSQSLPDHGPHCHWQTDLNSGIKSIRSNGTRYIQPNENSALKKNVDRCTARTRNAEISAYARIIERSLCEAAIFRGPRSSVKYPVAT